MWVRVIRLPKKKKKEAYPGQGVMNQLKAEVRGKHAAEAGSESAQWDLKRPQPEAGGRERAG